MKLKHLGIFLLLSTMAVFSACSDDDDDNGGVDLATEVKGNYKGDLTVTLDKDYEVPNSTISLTKKGDNQVELGLKAFSLPGVLPEPTDIVIPNVALKGKSGDVKVEGAKTTITLPGTEIKAEITTTGTVVGKKIDLDLVILAILGETEAERLPVAVTFAGNLEEGDK